MVAEWLGLLVVTCLGPNGGSQNDLNLSLSHTFLAVGIATSLCISRLPAVMQS